MDRLKVPHEKCMLTSFDHKNTANENNKRAILFFIHFKSREDQSHEILTSFPWPWKRG